MNLPTFLWIILLPVLASPVIYLAGRLVRNSRFVRLPALLAFLALAGTWSPFVLAARQLAVGQDLAYTLGSVTLRMDGLGLLLAAVALGLGTLVSLYSGPYLAKENNQEKFYAMLVMLVGMIAGLGCAADLFNLWIWFEAMAISSYLLVAFYRDQPASLEAGFKYLVQSAAGSVLVVIGIGLVFAVTGTLDLARIHATAWSSPLLLAAGALFVTGFGVKAALVPLHTWLPDAHSQAPSGISAMLSGVVIEAGLVALLRVLAALLAVSNAWAFVLLTFSALNMLVGNLLALRQKQIKRLLAFSSLAHVGYMLLGLGITFYTAQAAGAQGSLFHLLTHALMKGLAFLSAGVLLYCLYIADGKHGPLLVEDLAGAAKRYPLAALGLSLAVLGLGGLPPLAGFMSKWQIFVAGFQTRNLWIELLVVFAALNSVLSLAYYAPLVNAMYRLKPSERVAAGKPMPWLMGLPVGLIGLAIVVLGVWPGLVTWLTGPAAQALVTSLIR
ncbi:MAG TPA: proton-conducting transporter membrane subunit [Anaerolineales bacterium]|nr:proton-conducting transporter membrane subunit [Anaerolineales bacterium]